MQKEKVQSKNLLPNGGEALLVMNPMVELKSVKKINQKTYPSLTWNLRIFPGFQSQNLLFLLVPFSGEPSETVGRLPPHPLPVIVRLQSRRSPCRCHIITPNGSLQGSDQGTRLGGFFWREKSWVQSLAMQRTLKFLAV